MSTESPTKDRNWATTFLTRILLIVFVAQIPAYLAVLIYITHQTSPTLFPILLGVCVITGLIVAFRFLPKRQQSAKLDSHPMQVNDSFVLHLAEVMSYLLPEKLRRVWGYIVNELAEDLAVAIVSKGFFRNFIKILIVNRVFVEFFSLLVYAFVENLGTALIKGDRRKN
jgi:hypothetical protein